jgi:hypothetical protein
MINGLLLDHEFLLKRQMLRFTLRAPCDSRGQGRRNAGRSARQSNLPVESQVQEVGAQRSRSLPYVAQRNSYGEAGVETRVFALSCIRVRVGAGSSKFVRRSFQVSTNAPGLPLGFQCVGIDESCVACYSIYPFHHPLRFWIDRNRAPKKMSAAFNAERVHGKDGRVCLRKFRPRSKFPPFPRLRTGIRPRIFG